MDQASSHQDLNPQQKVGSEWENNRDVSAGVGTGKEIALSKHHVIRRIAKCKVSIWHLLRGVGEKDRYVEDDFDESTLTLKNNQSRSVGVGAGMLRFKM